MPSRILVPALLLAVVATGLALLDPLPEPATGDPHPAMPSITTTTARDAPAIDADTSEEVRWALRYSHQAAIDDHAVQPTTARGEWRVVALGPDRRRVVEW